MQNAVGRRRGHRRPREQGEEFDPIHQHHFYCPWVNGCVAAAAGSSESNLKAALCGWQLTVDALDAFQSQSNAFATPMESESAASMHKVSKNFVLIVFALFWNNPQRRSSNFKRVFHAGQWVYC